MSYVAPVQGQFKRQDQGVDVQGKPGDHVVAIGLARVDAVKDDPGGFGKVVYYTLLDGPNRGQQIYVGHAQPTVAPGRIVQAGDPVATLLPHGLGNAANLSGWTEIGFAKNGAPEPGSAGRFHALYSRLAASTTSGAAAAPPSAAASPPDISSIDSTMAQPEAPPQPETTQPQVYAPGSNVSDPYALWQRVVQASSSPDPQTLAYQDLAAQGG